MFMEGHPIVASKRTGVAEPNRCDGGIVRPTRKCPDSRSRQVSSMRIESSRDKRIQF